MAATMGTGTRHESMDLDLCKVLHPAYWMRPDGQQPAVAAPADEPDGEPDVHVQLATIIRLEDVPAFLAARRRWGQAERAE